MKYQELINEIERYELKYEWEERIASWSYLKTVEKFRDVQRNLRVLDNTFHLQGVIKPFLIHWGKMARVVKRASARDWETLDETLRSLEDEFRKLRGKKLLTMSFNRKEIIDAVKSIYVKRYFIPYLGGTTNISKILHVLNPEVFVIWDGQIRKWYKEKNRLVNETPKGYLEFLKEMKKQLEEAFNDYQSKTDKSWVEIEREFRNKYNNKTLAKLVDEYNWIRSTWNWHAKLEKVLEIMKPFSVKEAANEVGEKDIDLMCVHLDKWVDKGILYRVYKKGQAWYMVPKVIDRG